MTYHSLELPFLTPLINVFENEWEYIKIMENLHYYMNQKITFAYQHKDGTSGTEWPVGHLGDVLIHFRHAKSFEEGLQDWERRKGRINYDNIFAMMYTENIQVAERFDKLPYERKVCFFPFNSELPSVHSLKMVNKEKNLWDIINGLGENNIKEYDVLELLSGIDNYTRISDK